MSYIDEPVNARVRSVKGNQVLVEREDGFEEWMESSQLVKRGDLKVREVDHKDHKPKRKHSVLKREKTDFLEVDLHIHELVENSRGMTNYQMLQKQLDTARLAIEKARRSFVKKVILIHGVGEGRLRSELHQMLMDMDRLNFYDADFNRYGAGATEVELF